MRTAKIIPSFAIAFLISGCGETPPERATKTSSGVPIIYADMSDAQILRALNLDLSKVKRTITHGADGSSTLYSNGPNEIIITDSAVSGKAVARMKPIDEHEVWTSSEHQLTNERLVYADYRMVVRAAEAARKKSQSSSP